jgi:hypothetical protein
MNSCKAFLVGAATGAVVMTLLWPQVVGMAAHNIWNDIRTGWQSVQDK